MTPSETKTGQQRRILSALGAGALYGCWAFAMNIPHGVERAMRAVGIQVVTSFLLALIAVHVAEWLFQRVSHPLARIVVATGGAAGLAAVLSVTAHWLAGTPELLRTVALSMTLGTTLNLGYVLVLHRGVSGSEMLPQQ
jgi:hypothetical protein